jgi:hypothetical protein
MLRYNAVLRDWVHPGLRDLPEAHRSSRIPGGEE